MKHLNSISFSLIKGGWLPLVCLSIIYSLYGHNLNAQVSNYSFTQSWNTYTPVTGTVVAEFTGLTGAASMDDAIFNIPDGTIPFPFVYDGVPYTGCNVSTNGFLTFGTVAPAATNYVPISNAALYGGAVAAFGRDLQGGWAFTATRTTGSNVLTDVSNQGPLQIGDLITATGFPAGTVITGFGAGTITVSNPATTSATNYSLAGGGASWSNIRYDVIGTAPNRTFVVQWSGFKRFGTTTATTGHLTLNFQIRLNETDMSVEVVYGNCSPGISTLTTVSQVGLRGPSNVFPANVNNRMNTKGFNDNWLGSEPGVMNTSGMIFNNVDPANVIVEGLTYRWVLEDCSGVPTPGNTLTSLSNLCSGGTVTLSLENDTQGLGVTYQWQSSTSPGGPWTNFGSGNPTEQASVSANSYFRCIVTCAGQDGISTPVEVTVFYVACQCDPNPLCASNATNLVDEYLTNVTFAGINNSSGSTGYSDFRCFQGLVNAGDTYAFSADVTNGSASQFTETVRVFIDWDQNNVFDASEQYDMGIIPVPGGGTLPFTGSITVPLTATPGITYMRVIQRFSTYHPTGGCGTFTFGEVEDYWLNVTDEIPPTANFSVNDPLACVGQCLNFTDLSTGEVSSYAWEFPGSSTNSSSDQNPSNICFTDAGTHIIVLTVSNQFGSDDFTMPIEVFACGTPGCTYPDATNYNPAATADDGSCQFDLANPCPADINGDGLVNFADLTLFLGSYGSVCP